MPDKDTLRPILQTITVRRGPDEAFRLFTAEIARWWPLATHHLAPLPPMACAIEPFAGGRVYETAADGVERAWGEVLAWAPPGRFAMSWAVNAAPGEETTVTVTFTPAAEGTEVQLEHAGWERLGPERGAARRASYETGWDGVFGENYGRLAGRIGPANPEIDEGDEGDL
jgi:hypothetical protein